MKRMAGAAMLAARRDGGAETGSLLRLFVCVTAALAFLTIIEGAVFRFERREPLDWLALSLRQIVAWSTCAAMVPPLYWLVSAYPVTPANWRRRLWPYLAASALATIGKYTLYVPIRHAIEPAFEASFAQELARNLLGELMFFWAVIGLLHALRLSLAEAATASKTPMRSPSVIEGVAADTFLVDGPRGPLHLPTSAIDWFEAEGNYVRVHAGKGSSFLVRSSLKAVAERLGSGSFMQVHRSAIVNIHSVTRYIAGKQGRIRIVLADGAEVPCGRSYQGEVLDRLQR